jgi:hypothetical protein
MLKWKKEWRRFMSSLIHKEKTIEAQKADAQDLEELNQLEQKIKSKKTAKK